VITGVVNLLDAAGKPTGKHMATRAKAAQLRRFRDQILPGTTGGRAVSELLRRYGPNLAAPLLTDETALGLAIRAAAPWIAQPSNFEMLQATIDETTVRAFGEFTEYLGQSAPPLAPILSSLQLLLAGSEGQSLAEVMSGSALPTLDIS
jgi:hypothetical protein